MDEVEALILMNPLDCGSCSNCCQSNPGIYILEELDDDPSLYEGYLDYRDGQPILKTKPNGDCIFLDREKGCTAYDIRPNPCRSYDCRRDYMKWIAEPRAERRALLKRGFLKKHVQYEGRKRLKAILSDGGVSMPAE